jgi:hypothetical protein
MKAEDLQANRVLRGPIFSEPVQVIVTAPLGDAVDRQVRPTATLKSPRKALLK